MTRTRVISALVMAPIAISAILLLPTPWMSVLAAAVFMGGLWEWLKLSDVDDTLARSILVALNLLLLVVLVWASHSKQGGTTALLTVMTMIGVVWWVISALWLRFPSFGSHHERWSRVCKLFAASLAILPAWCALMLLHSGADDVVQRGLWNVPAGHWWLLTALATVWMADSGAYFAGKKFGKRKMSPRISPNKTVEGLLGGIVAGVVTCMIFSLATGISAGALPAVALVGMLTVVAAVIGALFESLLKRHAGAKDSSDLIPGHGGILDRVDSVLAALPVFALSKLLLGL